MKEQIEKILKDLAVENDEEHLLDINTLYVCFKDNVTTNCVYAQMSLFKYLFCVIVSHCLDNQLTAEDYEIAKYYTEFVKDKQHAKNSMKILNYHFVTTFYYKYARKLHNKLIEDMFNNIKEQFVPNRGHTSAELSNLHRTHNYIQNRHWYTNGVTNVFCHECPEGFRPGKLQSGWSKKQTVYTSK